MARRRARAFPSSRLVLDTYFLCAGQGGRNENWSVDMYKLTTSLSFQCNGYGQHMLSIKRPAKHKQQNLCMYLQRLRPIRLICFDSFNGGGGNVYKQCYKIKERKKNVIEANHPWVINEASLKISGATQPPSFRIYNSYISLQFIWNESIFFRI